MHMKTSPPRYWRERVSRYRLVGVECLDCGRKTYPPRPVCPYCGSRNTRLVELPKKGELVSYTVIYSVPEGFEHSSPVVYGSVKLDNGVLVEGQITNVEPSKLRVGLRVEATLRVIRRDGEHGIIEYGLKFRPADVF